MDMWVVFAQPNVWGKEKTLDYVTRIGGESTQDPRAGRRRSPSSAAGDLHITAEAFLFRAMANKDKGATIELVKANPLIGKGPKSFLSVNPPHPNAALVWLDWVYSPEGEKAIDEVLNKGNPAAGSNSKQAQIIKGLRICLRRRCFLQLE